MRPRGFHHLAVQIVDLPRAERFYVDVLGLRVLRRWPGADGVHERSLWVGVGATDSDGFFALERVNADATPAHDDAAHEKSIPGGHAGLHLIALAIGADERPAWRARLAAARVAIEKTTRFTLYVRDPEGNRVGLSHWPDPRDD